MSATEAARAPRYGFWLLASVPVALLLDVCIAGFAGFVWCGLNYCLNAPGDVGGTIACLVVAWLVMFLAVTLPPWIPGWRRPVIATAAGLLVAVVAGLYAFRIV